MRAPLPSTLATLRASAIANPQDCSVVSVYADALLERGDPRGEAIVHALTGDAPPRPELERAVTGRLSQALLDCAFENGLLRHATLRRVTPRELRRLTGRDEWSSVAARAGCRPAKLRRSSHTR